VLGGTLLCRWLSSMSDRWASLVAHKCGRKAMNVPESWAISLCSGSPRPRSLSVRGATPPGRPLRMATRGTLRGRRGVSHRFNWRREGRARTASAMTAAWLTWQREHIAWPSAGGVMSLTALAAQLPEPLVVRHVPHVASSIASNRNREGISG
jgi:hypothetical protein